MANSPRPFVRVEAATLPSRSRMVTATRGSAAPLGSSTFPVMRRISFAHKPATFKPGPKKKRNRIVRTRYDREHVFIGRLHSPTRNQRIYPIHARVQNRER